MLDNPIWHALSTVHASFAEGDDKARRYPPSISPLAGVQAQSRECYDSLSRIVVPGGVAALLIHATPAPPKGWSVLHALRLTMMVCASPVASSARHAVETLSRSDIAEMLSLAELTKPGPFSERTPELGAYLGVHQAGKLVAMAGERLRLTGFTEISAVCTHPDFRGRGYASALVSALVGKIIERGEMPFLHVKTDNAAAVRVYEELGFRVRSPVNLAVLRREVE